MSDEQVVQTGTSQEATPPVETPKPAVETPSIEQLVAKKLDELTPRIFQSLRDKAKFEANEAVARAQRETLGYKQEADDLAYQLGAVDPTQAELIRLRSRDRRYQEQGMTDANERQQAEFDSKFVGSMAESLQALDIDPKDTRIDWAEDAKLKGDYVERQKRILTSAAKISKENQVKSQESLSKKLVDEITAKVRRELGVDSVDTSTDNTNVSKPVFKRSEIQALWKDKKDAIRLAQKEGRIIED